MRGARLDSQHGVDGAQAARREAVVVALVARGGARVHDVVAVHAARRALLVVVRVVLVTTRRDVSAPTD